jgi:hypothetical protein
MAASGSQCVWSHAVCMVMYPCSKTGSCWESILQHCAWMCGSERRLCRVFSLIGAIAVALVVEAGCLGVEALICFSSLGRQGGLQDPHAGMQASTAWHQHVVIQSLQQQGLGRRSCPGIVPNTYSGYLFVLCTELPMIRISGHRGVCWQPSTGFTHMYGFCWDSMPWCWFNAV